MFKSIFLLLAFTFASLPLLADCKCDSLPTIQSAFNSANVVFLGAPASIIPNWISGGMKVTFKVEESWKRNIEKYFTLNVPEPANCGIAFDTDKKYLVFVSKNHAYFTDSCSRTQLLENAKADLSFLGKSIQPGVDSSPKTAMYLMGGLVLAGMAFVAFVVLRKKIFSARGK